MLNWSINREGLAIGSVIGLAVGIFIAAIIFLPNAEEKRAEITEPQYRLYCNAGAHSRPNGIEGASRGAIVEALKSWNVLGDGFKVFYMSGVSEWFASGNPCSIMELR